MSEKKSNDQKSLRRDERLELDDFWDIDRLLPMAKPRPVPSPRPAPTAVEIEVPARDPSEFGIRNSELTAVPTPARSKTKDAADSPTPHSDAPHYVPPHTAAEGEEDAPLADYRPDGVLIHSVRVFGWRSNFHYFDQFARDAEQYAVMPPPDDMPRRETFFSYFPQYVQLSRRQSAWYLWWREQVRGGTYPDTDYAYVLLYIFELINLPAEGGDVARRYRDLMASVWMAYRRAYPQLDHYMCEWLCDYCLIHALDAPLDILSPALDDIIAGSRLKEFYLVSVVGTPISPAEEDPAAVRAGKNLRTARILMRHCCQYDYRKSKFAGGEHKALFDKTIPAAVAATLPVLLGAEGQKPAITMLESTVTRDAYTGALCSYQNKRRIEVAYTSFSRSHELRFLIGDMVKHVENRLRAWIGVRSRLSVMALPGPLKTALDGYLDPLAPPKAVAPPKKKETPRPDYEALYDLPQKTVSLDDAAAIERASWETTRMLTEAFGEEENSEFGIRNSELTAVSPDPVVPHTETSATPHPEAADAPISHADASVSPIPHSEFGIPYSHLPFLLAALSGDRAAQAAASKAAGKMPDALADEINAASADGELGDIILEDDGSGFYAVIEDYREDVEMMYIGKDADFTVG